MSLCVLRVPLQVAILDSDEQRFLEASMAYSRGQPIMADEDFDALKAELRTRGSIVSAQVSRSRQHPAGLQGWG